MHRGHEREAADQALVVMVRPTTSHPPVVDQGKPANHDGCCVVGDGYYTWDAVYLDLDP